MLGAEESNRSCFPLHTAHATQHLCLYFVHPCNMIKILVWFEFEWLRNWILCRVFLIVSIDVIADNGTWAVSVLCMATASCVPHVGVWTIAHRNVARIKVALYIYDPATSCLLLPHKQGVHQTAGNWCHVLNCPERKREVWRSSSGASRSSEFPVTVILKSVPDASSCLLTGVTVNNY